jgi:hypothetical protein
MKLNPIPYQGGPLDGQSAAPGPSNRFSSYRSENGSTLSVLIGDRRLSQIERGRPIRTHFYFLYEDTYLHSTRHGQIGRISTAADDPAPGARSRSSM